MIPLKLALRNFMCYRDIPEINFEGIHTACISGNNGNGKSALIDAITWALWGQSRATSDDELVHSGQSEVEVEFEFAVETRRYRIIRKHSLPRNQKSSGQTLLEFQSITSQGYKTLSGDTASQTQQKIIQLLHMDYETFINSAFLRQGRADEFTKKRPGERKQVLSNILQLSIYDDLEERAKEAARKQETLLQQIDASLDSIQDELANKTAYETEFIQAENELVQAEKLTQEQESRLDSLRKDKEVLDSKKAQLTEVANHLLDTEKNYKLWNEQAQQCRNRVREYETLLEQRSGIEENYRRFIETRKQVLEFDQKLKHYNSLTQAKHHLEIAIVKAQEDLSKAHAVSENRTRELEIVSEKLPGLQEKLKQLDLHLGLLSETDLKLQEKRESAKLLLARVHFLQAEKTRLSHEIEQIDGKLKLISHDSGMTCPLCDTELGPDGQHRIEIKYTDEKNAKNELLRANQTELHHKEIEVKKLELDIVNVDTELKHAREVAQNQYGNISQAIADAKTAAEKISAEKNVLLEIEKKLALRDFAVNEQMAFNGIDKELIALEYDPQKHELLRAQLSSLEGHESPKRKLEEAEKLIEQEKEAEGKACRTAEDLRLKLESDNQRKLSLLSELAVTSRVAGDLMLAEMEYQKLLAGQKRAQQLAGEAKAKLKRVEELEIKKKEKENQRSETAREEKIFRDLAQAFGKKGIQAMLIEMTIPEIEIEANKLLARMTDNRMHVKIETQRESKKGDIMETLDINISDELGTRNYEMFSGGEAFRIDFAIRIALSKLLARRAGAPLPTLIIDEGFGTQDSTGIEKIKEAITSIQDDFEKILVITHIADFKDAFPMRIEVVKTPEGSMIYLN